MWDLETIKRINKIALAKGRKSMLPQENVSVVDKILASTEKATKGYSKQDKALVCLMAKNGFLKAFLATASLKEKSLWHKIVYNLLMNDVYPYIEEMGFERLYADTIPDLMKDDVQDIAFLRLLKLINAQQAHQMVRDSWYLGDSHQALFALKLNDDAGDDELLEIIKTVIAGSGKVVADYYGGKAAAANSLLGQTIKRAKEAGKNTDPTKTKELIVKTLDETKP
jgi:Asp-tRNA(Asn)/Glu-tRNA(Gln) amidotransferase B subunit